MKVTFDIPDKTMCLILSLIVDGKEQLFVKSASYNSEQLKDGNEITIGVITDEFEDA